MHRRFLREHIFYWFMPRAIIQYFTVETDRHRTNVNGFSLKLPQWSRKILRIYISLIMLVIIIVPFQFLLIVHGSNSANSRETRAIAWRSKYQGSIPSIQSPPPLRLTSTIEYTRSLLTRKNSYWSQKRHNIYDTLCRVWTNMAYKDPVGSVSSQEWPI
jgi:hypothetical protein